MGKVTGFLEIDRVDRRYAPASDRIRNYREFVLPLSEEATRNQAARCMNCGIPYCHNGCPVNNQIPDWNDLVYPRRLAGGVAQPPQHQQFPRIHRPRLPGAVRGLLHAQPPGRAGDDQDDRMRDRRPRLARRLAEARAAGAPHRQARRGRRLRPGGPRLRPATRARRPRSPRLREERQGGRPAALRHSRLQAREDADRSPRRADDGRGRRLPLRRRGRPRRRRRFAGRLLRRGRARRRRRGVARPAGPRPRTRRRPFRHGLPAAAEPPRVRRAGRDQRADPRRRQERRRHRRRRHRLGLHRHVDPPGRAQGDAARDPADRRPRPRTSC